MDRVAYSGIYQSFYLLIYFCAARDKVDEGGEGEQKKTKKTAKLWAVKPK